MRLALLTIALASCVASSQELRRPVDRLVGERLALATPGSPRSGAAPGVAADLDGAALDALLAKPIDTATAIRIALATTPRLRMAFDQLDIAAADVAAALGVGPVTVDAQLRFAGDHREYGID